MLLSIPETDWQLPSLIKSTDIDRSMDTAPRLEFFERWKDETGNYSRTRDGPTNMRIAWS